LRNSARKNGIEKSTVTLTIPSSQLNILLAHSAINSIIERYTRAT